jgi:UDP-2,3-diacylglucosamine pyrophosphatase LpxH
MIVVISDLHLQHTALDSLRRDEGGKVLETKVVRNVEAGALSLLFAEIAANAEEAGAKEVHLVFAGDIFELHRTPLWLLAGESLRPTLHPAADSPELEAKVHQILSSIEADNRAFFDRLRALVQSGVTTRHAENQALHGVPVTPHYLPGNHDRLSQIWPSTRKRVRELLGVTAADLEAPFQHQLEWNRAAGYGVRIRHGHEYDSANFSEAFDPQHPSDSAAYKKPVFGDYATIDIATRLAVAFRVFYAPQLRAPGVLGEPYRRIYAALTEFDDVRPQSMLVRYLSEYLGATRKSTFELLRPVLRDVVEYAQRDPFFAEKAGALAHGLLGPAAEFLKLFIANGSAEHVAALISLIDSVTGDGKKRGPASKAQAEKGLATGEIFVVIAGHTHQPDHVALPGQGTLGTPGGEAYFLDTGTWRTRLDAGEGGAFGRLRAYTMVFCYSDDELDTGDRRRFETWTGHLMAEDFGPMFSVDVTSHEAARPAKQVVRFIACQIESIDEGGAGNGAELLLFFGVDGGAQKLAQTGARNGQVLELNRALIVDPALDGELWCYGVEKDPGIFFDSDDPMPWAVTFLPRTSSAANAPFCAGPLTLRAADNRGNAFTLSLEVLA